MRIAATGVIAFLVGGALFTPQPDRVESAMLQGVAADTIDRSARPAAVDGPEDQNTEPSEAFTDLYGNEVSDAIATYTFDPSGSPYEVHSPRTELPRLGIPKS